jgi:hypothetical protein
MSSSRLSRERRTVDAMIRLYCRGNHGGTDVLCCSCGTLLAYAMERIDRCPFEKNKPTCARCAIHCYKKEMREQVRRVMRYTGPKMLVRHPILVLLHLMDGMKKSRK